MPAKNLVEQLVKQALDIGPSERVAFLRLATADDVVRAQVLAILQNESPYDALAAFLRVQSALYPASSTAGASSPSTDATGPLVASLGDVQSEDAFPWQPLTDRYILQGSPMKGGMGRVWHAIERNPRRFVAVKRLLKERDESALKRFHREAQHFGQLIHPHILRLYSVGRDNEGEYLIMEWAAGGTLLDCLSRSGPMSVARVCDIARAVASALDYAHCLGIFHRDIKPSNLLLDGDNQVKLGDFGLARSLTDPKLTSDGQGVGSPAYVAPEQWSGKGATAQADLYSLAKTLYHLLTDCNPIAIDSARIPVLLRPLLLRCLDSDPTKRPRSAKEFLDELAAMSDPRPRRLVISVGIVALIAATAAVWRFRALSSQPFTIKQLKVVAKCWVDIIQTLAHFFSDRTQPGEWGSPEAVRLVITDPEFPRVREVLKGLGDLRAPLDDLRAAALRFIELVLETCRKNPDAEHASSHVTVDIGRAATETRTALKSGNLSGLVYADTPSNETVKVAECVDKIMTDIEGLPVTDDEPFMRGDWQRRFGAVCRLGGNKLNGLWSSL